jgi:hypothetical protein
MEGGADHLAGLDPPSVLQVLGLADRNPDAGDAVGEDHGELGSRVFVRDTVIREQVGVHVEQPGNQVAALALDTGHALGDRGVDGRADADDSAIVNEHALVWQHALTVQRHDVDVREGDRVDRGSAGAAWDRRPIGGKRAARRQLQRNEVHARSQPCDRNQL